jgi:ribosomal protein L13
MGRLATKWPAFCAVNKPEFTPFLDTGDYVIVVNAARWS